ADHLNVTVSTVTRAYKYAQEMGLITGQVGRGSFVAIPGWNSAGWDFPENRLMRTGFRGQTTVDMMLHRPSLGVPRSVIPPALVELTRFRDLRASFDYPTPTGSERHRFAGAEWMKLAGLEIDPEGIVLCSGAQQALFTAMATNAEPGDVVVVEQVNY